MRRQADRDLRQFRHVFYFRQVEPRWRLPGEHRDRVFKLRPLPDQVDQAGLGVAQLGLRLGHRILAGNPRPVLVFAHFQRALIGLDRGFEQALLLIDNPQLQVVLHQFRLLAQTHGRKIGQAGFGARLVGFQATTQFAPHIGLPTDPDLGIQGVANAAAGAGQAGVGTAGTLAGAGLAHAQVGAGQERSARTAHQSLGLTELGFGLGHALVGTVEFFDQGVELLVAIQFPPCATGQ